MSWARLDDRYDDNRKVKRAWRKDRAAIGLHAMAITYCARHLTDGVVDIDWIVEKLHKPNERKKALDALEEAGLFERVDDEHWTVHDYLEYNPSASDSADRARDRVEAGRRGGFAKARNKQTASTEPEQTPSKPLAEPLAPARGLLASKASPVPSRPVPSLTASSGEPDLDAARTRLKAGHEQQVFDAWIKATDRTGATVLTDKRKRLIRQALGLYALPDVIDAVQGWRKSPHHRGENDTGTVYNDLELLLRDAAHIERFRDLQRSAGGQRRRDPTVQEIQAAEQARRDAA